MWGVSVPRFLHTSVCRVLKGELVTAIPVDERVPRNDGLNHNYRTLTKESPATFYHDENEYLDLCPLLANDFGLLVGIKSDLARYQFFAADRLDWATKLKVGARVLVELSMVNPARPGSGPKASAVIRYVGPLPGIPGVSFGVEIKVGCVSLS